MSYAEATTYLDGLGVDAMKTLAPSLHRMEALMTALDHPERTLPAVHVTGTNGKTSTARIAAALLTASGLKVGTYTSPHLENVRERIVRDGAAISEAEFGDLFGHIKPYIDLVESELDEKLSYFEVLTGMFFLWAADSVDVMVVEVGLGGKWDATNVLGNVPVAVVTNVSLDHTGMLGMERTTIAKEKAGIIKAGSTVVTGERSPDVLQIIDAQAAAVASPVAKIDRDFLVMDDSIAVGGRYISVRTSGSDYAELFLPLHGSHQAQNCAVALEAVTSFLPEESLGDEVVAEGLAAVKVPGRLETLHPDDPGAPAIILDVAHNPDGMAALVGSLLEAFAFERAVVVIGILGDKDYRGMLTELTRLPCTLIATHARNVRSVAPGELEAEAGEIGLTCQVVPQISEAIQRAVSDATAEDIVVVTGSHYVVGEARSFLIDRREA